MTEQASAARLTAIAERLKAFVRNNSSPKCRVLSLGDECVCPLCDVDRLLAQIDTLRQEQARLEAEMAEAKASEQRQYDQSVEATVRMLQVEQDLDAARAQVEKDRATAQREIERVNGIAQRASADRDAARAALEAVHHWVSEADCCYGGSCIAQEVENRLDAALKGGR